MKNEEGAVPKLASTIAALEEVLGGSRVTIPNPTVSTSISRKINLGNYENVDIWASMTVPVDVENPLNLGEVQERALEILQENVNLLSRQLNEYVKSIKDRRSSSS